MTPCRVIGRLLLIGAPLLAWSPASAHAQPKAASPGAGTVSTLDRALDEAKALDTKAEKAADAKRWSEAVSLQEQCVNVIMTKAFPAVPSSDTGSQVMLLGYTSQMQLKVALYTSKTGNLAAAVDKLERVIQVTEKLGDKSPLKNQLPQLKAGLSEWKSQVSKPSSGMSSTKPSASPPPASSGLSGSSGSVVNDVKRAMELKGKGKTSEAIALFDQALPKLESQPGVDGAFAVAANKAAAALYQEELKHSKAEACHQRVLAITEKMSGAPASSLYEAVSGLGEHYLRNDEPERAAPLLMRAYDIATSSVPDKRADAVMALGRLLKERHDYKEAALLLGKARDLYRPASLNGLEGAVSYMLCGIVLAQTLEELDRFPEAEQLYDEAGSMLEPMFKQMPDLVRPMWSGFNSVVSYHYRKRRQWAKAESFAREALDQAGKSFDRENLAYANKECDLGEIFWASGDLSKSLQPIEHCFDVREKNIARVLASGSEEQKRAYVGSFVLPYQKTLTAQIRAKNDNEKMNRLAMNQVLRTKGRILDAMTGESLSIRRNATGETRALLDRLAAARTALAGLSASGNNVERIKQLEEDCRTLETRLSEQNERFRQATKEVSVTTVRNAIPAGSVLVELVAFRPLDPLFKRLADMDEQRYLAYILHGEQGAEPIAVDLGPSAGIDRDIEAFRAAIASPDESPGDAATRLYDKVMAPLEPHLRGKTNIIVSPDGALNAVPFAAMKKGGDYLVKTHTFTYVTSGRDLLRWGDSSGASKGMLVVANPDFAMNGERAAATSPFARIKFPSLPGTESEARAIGSLFPRATVVSGTSATEARLKRMEHPRVVHLATHGFFLSAPPLPGTSNTRGLELEQDEVGKTVRRASNPLLRSGLALAGAASLKGNDGEDGILTALEASTLDLSGTKLVVLSACQTAQGESRNGEGVYGLRRALAMAGAETLVMSLWSVDDEATSYLMNGYYKALKSGRGRSAALRDIQLKMASSSGVSHPYYWAAFIPSGDPSSMDMSDVDRAIGTTSSEPTAAPRRERDKPEREPDDEPTIHPESGTDLGFNYVSVTNLRDQRDRAGVLGSINHSAPFLSRWLAGRRFGLHDGFLLSGLVGLRTSDAVGYSNGEEEGGLAAGFRGGYEAALGVRTGALGVYAGAQAMYNTLILGDVRTYGTTLPLIAMIHTHVGSTGVGLRGSYGKWIVEQEAAGASLSIHFSSVSLIFGLEQLKMPTTVSLDGKDLRTGAGRQVTTTGTFALGGLF